MSGTIQLKKHPPSGTVVIQRPEKRNALNRAMVDQLRQALEDFHLERKVRAVILIGAGNAFCAGMDLAEMLTTSRQEDAWSCWHSDVVAYKELLELMLDFPKPLIAAIHGTAAAAGAGLALACDLVVGTEESQFGFPEPRRGLVAGMAAPLLHFRVGGSQAARLLLGAELISGKEAYRIGLFHELVTPHLLWARAHQLAEQCALAAPESLQLTKRLLNENVGEHLGVLLSAGAAATATARTTEAATEGLAAFEEKRTPRWL